MFVEYLLEDGRKKAETYSGITTCLYISVPSYSTVVGTYEVVYLSI